MENFFLILIQIFEFRNVKIFKHMIEILRSPNLHLFDYIQEYSLTTFKNMFILRLKIVGSNSSHMKEHFKLHIFFNNCYLSRIIHIIFCSHLLSSTFFSLPTYIPTYLSQYFCSYILMASIFVLHTDG